jgi:hypothetical protein
MTLLESWTCGVAAGVFGMIPVCLTLVKREQDRGDARAANMVSAMDQWWASEDADAEVSGVRVDMRAIEGEGLTYLRRVGTPRPGLKIYENTRPLS